MQYVRMIANRYTLEHEIGSGGMGTVYRGTDARSGQQVAVKMLKTDAASDPDTLRRFLREADALRELNHPSIVKVLDNAEEHQQHYIIMEYVAGGSLLDALKRDGRMSVRRVVEIALDLADALTRAHRLKIVHRDLKPANVLLADDGTPRLTDFGVAHIGSAAPITEQGVAVGTLDYLPPEVIQGDLVDGRADIWSFGVMLFEMLAGTRPFSGDTPADVLTRILMQPVPDLEALRPEVPVALVDLIYRMLEKNRDKRIPSVRLVGAELEALIEGFSLNTSSAYITGVAGSDDPAVVVDGGGRFDVSSSTVITHRHNFPAQTTPFIGRQAELEALARLLGEPGVRLVTILAPGGMGKTRLSIAAADGLPTATLAQFGDGVYFVPLAPIGSPEFIPSALGEALSFGFDGVGTPAEQLLTYLQDKRLLLVIDNCEHLLDGIGIVADILRAAPGVRVLATSRARLRLQGEHVFDIEGITLPAEDATPEAIYRNPAVQLFIQSARRVQPAFAPADAAESAAHAAAQIARICRLVQGMPLGIELAAAWLEVLSLDEIADEIARSLDFLETELRDVPERHRSIRAVFNYSWNLMTPEEQHVFKRVSVFRGGFDRDAAQQVADASLKTLMTLGGKSLVARTPTGRFHVHELLRQYALEQLQAAPQEFGAVIDRYIAHYSRFVAAREGDVTGPRQKDAMQVIEQEIENLRAVWWWALERNHADVIAPSLRTLAYFYDLTGRTQEGIELLTRLFTELNANPAQGDEHLRGVVEVTLASLRTRIGDYEGGRSVGLRALDYFRGVNDRFYTAYALNLLTYVAMMVGDFDAAQRYGEETLVLWEAEDFLWGTLMARANLGYLAYLRGDFVGGRRIYEDLLALNVPRPPVGMAYGLNNLGEIMRELGDPDRARDLFQQAYDIFKEFGNRRGMAFTATNLGGICFRQGDYDSAEQRFREGYRLNKDIGDRAGVAHSLSALGNLTVYTGRAGEAEQYYREALSIRRAIGEKQSVASSLSDLGEAALTQGRLAEAREYAEEALAIYTELGDRLGAAFIHFGLGMVLAAEGIRAPVEIRPHFQEALLVGEAFNHPLLISQAVIGLGEIALVMGDTAGALSYFLRCLKLALEQEAQFVLLVSLVSFAAVYQKTGQPERTLELVALILRYPRTPAYVKLRGQELDAELGAALPAHVAAAARTRGAALDLHETAQAVLAEFSA